MTIIIWLILFNSFAIMIQKLVNTVLLLITMTTCFKDNYITCSSSLLSIFWAMRCQSLYTGVKAKSSLLLLERSQHYSWCLKGSEKKYTFIHLIKANWLMDKVSKVNKYLLPCSKWMSCGIVQRMHQRHQTEWLCTWNRIYLGGSLLLLRKNRRNYSLNLTESISETSDTKHKSH